MNIFILDHNINKCAQYHCDKHVIKMLLEAAQILCTVCHKTGIQAAYKATHHHHPTVLWAEQSLANWRWLKKLVIALNTEYKYRYRKTIDHKSYTVVMNLTEPILENIGLTEFCQAMPQEFRIFANPVAAYRRYYLGNKAPIAKWTRRRVPLWFKNAEIN